LIPGLLCPPGPCRIPPSFPARLRPPPLQAIQYASGGARSARGLLAEALASLVPALAATRPAALNRHVLPAAVALMAEPRGSGGGGSGGGGGGDLRAAQFALLDVLGRCAAQQFLDFVEGLAPAVKERIKDALMALH